MRQVTKYTEAIKASVLSKALAPNAPGIIELSKEFNIPKGTIYTWLSNMNYKSNTHVQQRPKDRSPESKLQAVIDTIGESEEEQSAYCIAQGIYSHHLEAWKQQILESLGASTTAKDNKSDPKANKAAEKKLQSAYY